MFVVKTRRYCVGVRQHATQCACGARWCLFGAVLPVFIFIYADTCYIDDVINPIFNTGFISRGRMKHTFKERRGVAIARRPSWTRRALTTALVRGDVRSHKGLHAVQGAGHYPSTRTHKRKKFRHKVMQSTHTLPKKRCICVKNVDNILAPPPPPPLIIIIPCLFRCWLRFASRAPRQRRRQPRIPKRWR